MQNVNAGGARGHYGEPKPINPERAMEGTRNGEAEFLTTDYTDERGSGIEENVRLCSPMFAYVRLMGKKMFEAAVGERGPIVQHALQTEIGARATRPSEYQRQSQGRRSLDLGGAGWMRGNADRMNGKAECLSDRNPCFICDSG